VPGVDPGTGWSQRAELLISNTSNLDLPKHMPYRISDGLLKLDDVEHPNEIPIPLSYKGTITLNLLIGDVEYSYSEISITGDRVELRLTGEAEYIEDFPGAIIDHSNEDAT
jgi:hypothetical protein